MKNGAGEIPPRSLSPLSSASLLRQRRFLFFRRRHTNDMVWFEPAVTTVTDLRFGAVEVPSPRLRIPRDFVDRCPTVGATSYFVVRGISRANTHRAPTGAGWVVAHWYTFYHSARLRFFDSFFFSSVLETVPGTFTERVLWLKVTLPA